MGREATLRILKDGVDPENPNIVDRNLDAAMSAEYGHQMEAVEILKQTGKTDEDPEVVALMEKAAESFDFAKDREELITNIRAMMEGSAAEDVELNNFFTSADEKKISHWLLLLLTDIQTMFGDDRHDRILDIYTLGSLVNKDIFDRLLKRYGDDIGFDAQAEFYAAMPTLRDSDNTAAGKEVPKKSLWDRLFN